MPRKWLTAADVPPDSGVGRQLQAMRDFVGGRIDADTFIRNWLDGRRAQAVAYDQDGTRPGARIEDALDALFFAVDDYDPSPTLRDPQWIDADQLREATRDALTRIESLRSGGWDTT